MLHEFWETLNQPLFWLALSVAAYAVGQRANALAKTPICNPLLIATFLIAVVMVVTDTPLADYNVGGGYVTMLLTPATVSLAVPIYRKLDVLKKNLVPVLAGALAGSVTSIISVLVLTRLFNLPEQISRSLLPKSVTTPIGIRISEQLGGIPSLTAIIIVLTGIVGAILAPTLLRLLHLDEPVALGVGMGTGCHAFGTATAIQIGETQGAMSGLSLGVAGVFTAILLSILNLFL